MTRPFVRLLRMYAVLVLSVSAIGAAPVQTTPALEADTPPIPLVEAHRDLLADVIEQSGVTTVIPQPGTAAYFAYAVSRLVDAIVGWLSPLGKYAGGIGSAFVWVAGILIAVSMMVLLFALGRYLIRRRRRSPLDERADVAPESEQQRRERDRDEWRAELEGRLAHSDVNGALEATWWWLARSVLGESVRSSWTSGELLFRARRPALREPLRTLERLMYGGVLPSVDEVRALARDLEETLA